MLYSFWEFSHSIGLHFYTIPSIVTAVVMAVVALVHHLNQKKREKDMEKTDDAAQAAEA